jgi:hypothetical protein
VNSFFGVGLFDVAAGSGGCGSALVRVDLFQQGDGLADLLEIVRAAVAGAEVIVDAGPPVRRELAVEVVAD